MTAHEGAYVPAVCGAGHVYYPPAVFLRAGATLVHEGTMRCRGGAACPECGGEGRIESGTYVVRDGAVVREDEL